MISFVDVIYKLNKFWSRNKCIIHFPYDLEKGAASMNPNTFFKVLGPEPFFVAYLEPCRRPSDSRYGDDSNRLQYYYQYQVLIKPSLHNTQDLYLESLKNIGIDIFSHDIKFVEDNWESHTIGAWGIGWEVLLDGIEISQFTYFQQCGGIDCMPISVEVTYGLERIVSLLQKKNNFFSIKWDKNIQYGELFEENEKEFSKYNFKNANIKILFELFELYQKEANNCLKIKLIFPGYEYILKCSHVFNILNSRGILSVSERASYIIKIRSLAKIAAKLYIKQREKLEFPLLKK